jgi:hypothetical protein
MPRPLTKSETPRQRKLRLEANARRRAKRQEQKREEEMMEAAESAAEGASNFDELVDAQRRRIDAIRAGGAKGAAQSPKTVRLAREHLPEAFDFMGGVAGLVAWGKQNPTEFYRIWARLVPKEAAPEAETMPLETLLAKLAEREHLSITDAAIEIGAEKLEQGRAQAAREDAEAALAPPSTKYEIN